MKQGVRLYKLHQGGKRGGKKSGVWETRGGKVLGGKMSTLNDLGGSNCAKKGMSANN